jgi:uncharacterized protein (TIGR02588 family)
VNVAERAEDRRQRREEDQRSGANDMPPMWEWVVALFGVVLVLGSIGFMAYQVVAGDDSPPDVLIRTDTILPVETGYLVQIRAVNQGGSTAAELRIEGTLRGERGRVETSEIVIDYIPAHSHRKGGLFFTQDPRQFTLQLRAKGYAEP